MEGSGQCSQGSCPGCIWRWCSAALWCGRFAALRHPCAVRAFRNCRFRRQCPGRLRPETAGPCGRASASPVSGPDRKRHPGRRLNRRRPPVLSRAKDALLRSSRRPLPTYGKRIWKAWIVGSRLFGFERPGTGPESVSRSGYRGLGDQSGRRADQVCELFIHVWFVFVPRRLNGLGSLG